MSEKRKFTISDGLIVGAITLLGYSCAYFFEKGYLDHYYLPDTLIEISIPTVIRSIAYTLGIALILAILLNGLLGGIPVFKNEFINLSVERLLWFSNIFFLLTLFSGLNTLSLFTFFGAVILFGMLLFVAPLIQYKKVKGYKNKIKQAIFDEEDDNYKYSLMTLIRKKFGKKGIIASIIFLYIVASFSYVQKLGDYWASNQENYFLIDGSKQMLVIGTYKNNFIAAEVNLKNKEIYPVYKIIKTKNLEMEIIVIKDLKVKKPISK